MADSINLFDTNPSNHYDFKGVRKGSTAFSTQSIEDDLAEVREKLQPGGHKHYGSDITLRTYTDNNGDIVQDLNSGISGNVITRGVIKRQVDSPGNLKATSPIISVSSTIIANSETFYNGVANVVYVKDADGNDTSTISKITHDDAAIGTYLYDKNSQNIGAFRTVAKSNGNVFSGMRTTSITSGGESVSNEFRCVVHKDGSKHYYVSDETAFRKDLGITAENLGISFKSTGLNLEGATDSEDFDVETDPSELTIGSFRLMTGSHTKKTTTDAVLKIADVFKFNTPFAKKPKIFVSMTTTQGTSEAAAKNAAGLAAFAHNITTDGFEIWIYNAEKKANITCNINWMAVGKPKP